MEHTWTKDFYQETDPAKRQQILKEYIGEEEAWEEEYRARLWTCLLYTSPSPRDPKTARMPSSA